MKRVCSVNTIFTIYLSLWTQLAARTLFRNQLYYICSHGCGCVVAAIENNYTSALKMTKTFYCNRSGRSAIPHFFLTFSCILKAIKVHDSLFWLQFFTKNILMSNLILMNSLLILNMIIYNIFFLDKTERMLLFNYIFGNHKIAWGPWLM